MDHTNNPHGYCGIGIFHGKTEINFGTLVRSAYSFGASYVFTIGRRYRKESSAIALDRHIPIFHYDTFEEFRNHLPFGTRMVMVELHDQAESLVTFVHPRQAVYLLGAEDHGIPEPLMAGVQIVQVPGCHCLNVASAGTVVLYDRYAKQVKAHE